MIRTLLRRLTGILNLYKKIDISW